MLTTIRRYGKSCIQCQIMKNSAHKSQGLLMPLAVGGGRWIDIAMDFATDLPRTRSGFDIIMVVVCRFSKRAHFIPCTKTLDAQGMINLLYRFVFAYHGFPRTITSDRDMRPAAKLFREFTKRLGIKLTTSSSNHPQTYGQSKRTIQTLNRLLRAYSSTDHSHWDELLPQVEYVFNSTPSRSSGQTPFEIDCGFNPTEPNIKTDDKMSVRSFKAVDLARRLKRITILTRDYLTAAQERQEANHNRGRKKVEFKIGEYVLLHRDVYHNTERYWKVQLFFVGPFRIVKKINENAFELDLPFLTKKRRVFNMKWLKKFFVREGLYYERPPQDKLTKLNKSRDTIPIIGYDPDDKRYHCKLKNVDPQIRVAFKEDERRRLPKQRSDSLLRNLQILTKFENPREDLQEEDAIERSY
ncbi:hypothetical protein HG537_0C03280 [Torulaspora globosa]|uniref:Integrase catalytic domain-containing protein n=1 Tax=Torulaspora globosa TaxID=48254 RepID=A0A7H9HQN2_9SACH|nr:hypothetical protein HG537_0C03280 [Torulaspora sp. CBS 2947]